MRKKVLVLCTANSGRSIIAHAYLEALNPSTLEVYSAGLETKPIHELAKQVLKEDGIDISSYTSNHLDEYKDIDFDFVITVCDEIHEQCPVFPAKIKIIHASFPDPTKASGSEVDAFRTVRDQIRAFIGRTTSEYLNVSS